MTAPSWSTPRPVASLLDELLSNTLDPAYAEAAARRARSSEAAQSRPPGRPAALVALVAVGVVLAIAAGQQQLGAPDVARARARLATEVGLRTATVASLTAAIEKLRADTAATRDRELALSRDGAQLTSLLGALERATGSIALNGPGLVVRVSDAPTARVAGRPTGSTRDEGRVQDRDLQAVVNALWAAGAEGIAVNGVRLTGQTAIRSAGEAILVDFRPLSSPYDVSAVGPSDALQASFADSAIARRFYTWTQLYQLGFSVRQAGTVALAAAAPAAPRHAVVFSPSPAPAGSPAPSRSGGPASTPPAPSSSEHTP